MKNVTNKYLQYNSHWECSVFTPAATKASVDFKIPSQPWWPVPEAGCPGLTATFFFSVTTFFSFVRHLWWASSTAPDEVLHRVQVQQIWRSLTFGRLSFEYHYFMLPLLVQYETTDRHWTVHRDTAGDRVFLKMRKMWRVGWWCWKDEDAENYDRNLRSCWWTHADTETRWMVSPSWRENTLNYYSNFKNYKSLIKHRY